MNLGSCILKLLVICVLSSSGSPSTSSKIKVQGTIIKEGEKVVRGVEGKDLKIVCNIESGIPAITFVMRIDGIEFQRVGSGNLTYSFVPSKIDNMQSFVCFAYSIFLVNPLSCKILLDIQYSPVVTIVKEVTEKKLILICNPNGNPENYTFADWEHWSEFNEYIRNVTGTPDSTLIFLESSNNSRLHENDGIYKCKTSNGIHGTNGKLYQIGSALINDRVPPVFLNANDPIQFGRYGQKMNVSVLLYNKFGTIQTDILKLNESLNIYGRQETIRTHDMFHDVNVRVSGIKITFQLTLDKIEDFRDYTIKACNEKGCNKLTVKIRSSYRPEPPTNVSVAPFEGYLAVSWRPVCKFYYKADRPEPPTNVSVIPLERHLAVLWCPEYNGGEPQTFFIEYQQEADEMWRCSGPIIDNMQVRMSNLLYNMTPNTRYCVRLLSRNAIGESNKTAVTPVMTSGE
ncbi:unnamed protein product [Mytilus coruscus]|uniref:Fibronectin type-III domain-containing protein n=1 Tax=Mytilus coruscus TaxID=42192 RepID=A0A6J8CGY0_MYTCO|nr:unnamed protein product [Mytilus coruscus]